MSKECEVEGEDEVIFRTIGDVVVFVDVEEVEARMALFERTEGTYEKGAPVLDVDSHGVKTAACLLVDC
jgi:chaperonin cofactor prefoldin